MLVVYFYCVFCILLFADNTYKRKVMLSFGEAGWGFKSLDLGLVLCGLALFLVHGFRYLNFVGADEYFYRMIPLTASELTHVEYLNVLIRGASLFLSKTGIYIFQYGQFYILVMSALWIFLIFRGLERFSKDVAFSLFIILAMGVLLSSMNIIRQSVSAAIILNGYNFIKEKKFGKFLIVVAIACGFHISAIIMIPFYFVVQSRSFYKRSILYLCAVIIGYNVVKYTLSIILNGSHYSLYFSNQEVSGASLLRIAFYVLPGVIIIIRTIGKAYPSSTTKNILALFAVICILSFKNLFIMRINTFLLPIIACEYSRLPEYFEGNKKLFIKYVYVVLLLSFGIVEYGIVEGQDYYNILFYHPNGAITLH